MLLPPISPVNDLTLGGFCELDVDFTRLSSRNQIFGFNFGFICHSGSGWDRQEHEFAIVGSDDGYQCANLYLSDSGSTSSIWFISHRSGHNLDFFYYGGSGFSPAVAISPVGNLLLGSDADDGVNKLQVSGSVAATSINVSNVLQLASSSRPSSCSARHDLFRWFESIHLCWFQLARDLNVSVMIESRTVFLNPLNAIDEVHMAEGINVDPSVGGPAVIKIGDTCYTLVGPSDAPPTISAIDGSFDSCEDCADDSSGSSDRSTSGSSSGSTSVTPACTTEYLSTLPSTYTVVLIGQSTQAAIVCNRKI